MHRMLLALCLLLIGTSLLQAQPNGSALPDGARLRLGASGMGTGERVFAGSLSADGKLVALAGRDEITLLERASGKTLAKLGGLMLGIPQLTLSADGKLLAYATAPNIVLADVPTGRTLQTLTAGDNEITRPRGLSISANGKVVAVGEDRYGARMQPQAYVWDTANGKLLAALTVAQNSACFTALSPDGGTVATWGKHVERMIGDTDEPGRIVQLWDVAKGKERLAIKLERPNTQIQAVAFAPDGKTLAVACSMTHFYLFDAHSGKELRSFAGRRSKVETLSFSPDGTRLVAGALDGAVQAWQVADGTRVAVQAGPRKRIAAVAFAGAEPILALGIGTQDFALWDVLAKAADERTSAHRTPLLAVQFADDGKSVTSASQDGMVLQWDANNGKLLRSVSVLDEELRGAAVGEARLGALDLSADGRYAATNAVYANYVRLWNLQTGQPACDFELARGSGLFGLAFAPDSARLAAVGLMKTIHLWEVATGQGLANLSHDVLGNATGGVPRLRFAPDGKHLAVAITTLDAETGTPLARLLLLDAATGKQRLALAAPSANTPRAALAPSLAFSADGKLLAFPGPNLSIALVRTETGKEWKRLERPGGFPALTALAFSPDGRTLAVAHGFEAAVNVKGEAERTTPTVELWELASGQRRQVYAGHQGRIQCLAFAPDGSTLASGSDDATVVLWDLDGRVARRAVPEPAPDLWLTAWPKLGEADAETAFRIQQSWLAQPGSTVAFLAKHLKPAAVAPVDPKRLAAAVAELDSDEFSVRDQAFRLLEKQGAVAEPALRQARTKDTSLEMRRRIDTLLEKIERGSLTAAELQALRSVEVLERLGTPAARALLATLAGGAETAVLTREARQALGRLKR